MENISPSLRQKISNHLSATYHFSPDKVEELVSSAIVTLTEQFAACRADIDGGDQSSLAASAHTLKGSLLNIGFQELGERIDKLGRDAAQGRERPYDQEFSALEQELAELFI